VHHYPHSIGDYRRDTMHLTLLEHGIYRQLLDTYYLTESPLCADDATLMRSHCVRTPDECAAFKNVLKDFFSLTENGYIHGRCEKELAAIYAKSDKASASAKTRWQQKQGVSNSGDANASETHSERNANAMLPNTQHPTPIESTTLVVTPSGETPPADEFNPKKPESVPFGRIVDLYHELLPTLPTVADLSAKRKAIVRARWQSLKPESLADGLNEFRCYFERVAKSKFLTGKSPPVGDRKPFRANFEWLMNESNFLKVIEGNYDA